MNEVTEKKLLWNLYIKIDKWNKTRSKNLVIWKELNKRARMTITL